MKIKKLLELADKQTIFGDGMQINTFGSWGVDNKAFLKAAPETAEKLRDIMNLMPEILETIEFASFMTKSGRYKEDFEKLIKKLETWENN